MTFSSSREVVLLLYSFVSVAAVLIFLLSYGSFSLGERFSHSISVCSDPNEITIQGNPPSINIRDTYTPPVPYRRVMPPIPLVPPLATNFLRTITPYLDAAESLRNN